MNEIEIDIIEILKYIVRNIHKIFIFTVVFGISFLVWLVYYQVQNMKHQL